MSAAGSTKIARNIAPVLLAAAALLAACEHAPHPVEPEDARFHHGGHLNALVERAWGDARMWELVKPRPPGLGAPGEVAIHLYLIAPVHEADPLSPPIHVPGFLTVGGRDHVVPTPAGTQGAFRGVARSVPLEVPGWTPTPPFGDDQCAAPAVDGARIAWRWVEVSLHPCGRVPLVYAVRLDAEECRKPLASVGRVRAAVDQGLAVPTFPEEPGPWPFAIRPLTRPGQGRVTIEPPACID
jgi:hypothetical protein